MCALIFNISHRPVGNIADVLAPTGHSHLCSTAIASVNYTVGTCRRDLQCFHRPHASLTFCSLVAGRWCRSLGRHSGHLIVHHQWEHSICACSCSKVPIAPMGKSLHDMSISILIFYDGCCLELPVRSTCHLRLKLQKFPSPRWDSRLLVVCRAAVSLSMVAQCQS